MSRLTFVLAAFVISACGPDDTEPPSPAPTVGTVETPPAEAPTVTAPSSGLPCDVERVLEANCGSCHGATPANGAPSSLITREELLKESTYGTSLGERSVVRMKDSAVPMPPSYFAAKVKPADVAVVESWVNGGMVLGACPSGP